MTGSQADIRNWLLAALPAEDFELLHPLFERVPLALGKILVAAHDPIRHGSLESCRFRTSQLYGSGA
ncbi:hypothetical protein GCM10007884_35360 [Methylobacterium brachythecii]|uniref:Uncharacterized protein n=1 Tax=Methylobacterium brachythecii TaxID=1176177 RepID=A0ABQ6D678_9HYPH|nr:hypothetical protein GCM10007884_35360 [Methylobacterium brachythecii]